jgi:transcriptional regulator
MVWVQNGIRAELRTLKVLGATAENTCLSGTFPNGIFFHSPEGKTQLSAPEIRGINVFETIDALSTHWVNTCEGMKIVGKPNYLVQGTLGLLILKTISLEPMHGWAIGRCIQQMSEETLLVQQGSLYPALQRLEKRQWIKGTWERSTTGRRAKVYSITRVGRMHLEQESTNWNRLSAAINVIVNRA